MNVITELLRGRGKRRAADRISVLEGQLASTQALVTRLRDHLTHADILIAHACQQRDSAIARNTVLAAELEALQVKHKATIDAYDELVARYLEAEADLRNLRAISSPAPADSGLPIALPNLDDTREMRIPDVWTIDGLRPLEPVTGQAA